MWKDYGGQKLGEVAGVKRMASLDSYELKRTRLGVCWGKQETGRINTGLGKKKGEEAWFLGESKF